MAVYPEHILPTEDLGDRQRFDVGLRISAYTGYTLQGTWHWLKSQDYTEVWVEWEQQSQSGGQTWCYIEVSDGISTANSAEFNTALLGWQDSVKSIISLAGFNNVICTLKLYVAGKGRVRGIVALEA